VNRSEKREARRRKGCVFSCHFPAFFPCPSTLIRGWKGCDDDGDTYKFLHGIFFLALAYVNFIGHRVQRTKLKTSFFPRRFFNY